MTEPNVPDPAAELLAFQREQQERRDRNSRDIRHGVAAFVIIGLLLMLLLAYLAGA